MNNLLPSEQWLFAVFGVFIIVFLLFDLGVFQRKAHKVSFRAALWQTIFWFTMAMGFALLIAIYRGKEESLEFIAAYLTEQSLSVDNMFIFVLIFRYFKIPEHLFHRVLFYGVVGAIVFRAIFIWAGIILVAKFHWILYIFGAILVITGVRMFFTHKDEKFEPERNLVYRFLTKYLRFTQHAPEEKFYVKRNNKIYFTTLFLVVCLIETTDILFALDSIPAVFAISQNQFVIYTSNIFAVMGLRALFFLLIDIMNRFHFLQRGLALILIFIGLKMLAEILGLEIPTAISLGVIVSLLTGTIVLSLLIPEKKTKG